MNRDASGHGLSVRALTLSQCQAVASALLNGVDAATLAAEYGVSKRTIYRAAKNGRSRWTRVEVLGWVAEFAVNEDGPVRCTPWYPA